MSDDKSLANKRANIELKDGYVYAATCILGRMRGQSPSSSERIEDDSPLGQVYSN